jgi:hypothetical protein
VCGLTATGSLYESPYDHGNEHPVAISWLTEDIVVEWCSCFVCRRFRLKFWPGDRLFWMLSWFSSVRQIECRDSTLKLGHDRILQTLPNSSFTCHPFTWHYVVSVTEEASLSKQQIRIMLHGVISSVSYSSLSTSPQNIERVFIFRKKASIRIESFT